VYMNYHTVFVYVISCIIPLLYILLFLFRNGARSKDSNRRINGYWWNRKILQQELRPDKCTIQDFVWSGWETPHEQ
jgi:hypothetical protein